MLDAQTVSIALLCRSGSRICALPIIEVVEVLRPLTVESIAGVAGVVRGAAVVRGMVVPVVGLTEILGLPPEPEARWVVLRVGARRAVLAVAQVLGVAPLAAQPGVEPLLREGLHEAVAAMGAVDEGLLMLLEGSRVVPESVWAEVAAR